MNNKKFRRRLPEKGYVICYWCGRKTTQKILRKGHFDTLQTNTDHVIPLCYSRSNALKNLVYACSFCNSFKAAFVFESDKQIREYLKGKWYAETEELFTMLTDFPSQNDLAEVLLYGMSIEPLAKGTAYRMPEVWRNNKSNECQMCGRRKFPTRKWLVDGVPLCSKECWDEYIEDALNEEE